MRTGFAIALLLSGLLAVGGPAVAADDDIALTIKDHRFDPAEVAVPAGKKVKLVVTNRGLRRLGVDLEPLAWIAGWGSKELVLSPPGGGRPLEVRPVAMAAPDQATGGTKR